MVINNSEVEVEVSFIPDPGLLLRLGRRDWPRPTHQHDVRIKYKINTVLINNIEINYS